MYCIVVYDIGEKRVVKMLKLLRGYLHWVQNSVFEGELTEGQVAEMMGCVETIMKKEEDSVVLYCLQNEKFLDRTMLGVDKSRLTSNFL